METKELITKLKRYNQRNKFDIQVNKYIPKNEIWFCYDSKIVGKIVNIEVEPN